MIRNIKKKNIIEFSFPLLCITWKNIQIKEISSILLRNNLFLFFVSIIGSYFYSFYVYDFGYEVGIYLGF